LAKIASMAAKARPAGEVVTHIEFPPAKRMERAAVWIQTVLASGDTGNILTFSTDCQPIPVIHALYVD
jgi:hypothetical protein